MNPTVLFDRTLQNAMKCSHLIIPWCLPGWRARGNGLAKTCSQDQLLPCLIFKTCTRKYEVQSELENSFKKTTFSLDFETLMFDFLLASQSILCQGIISPGVVVVVVMGEVEIDAYVDTDKEVETEVDGEDVEELSFSSILRVAFLKGTLMKDRDSLNAKNLNILLPAPRPSWKSLQ